MSVARACGLASIVAALTVAGCSGASPCLRHSDCASGTMCVAGACVAPDSGAGDAGDVDAAMASRDAGIDASEDARTDASDDAGAIEDASTDARADAEDAAMEQDAAP